MQLVQCEIFKKIVIYLFIKKNCSKTSKNSIFFLIKLIPYLRHYFCKTEKEIKLYSVPDLEYPILVLSHFRKGSFRDRSAIQGNFI